MKNLLFLILSLIVFLEVQSQPVFLNPPKRGCATMVNHYEKIETDLDYKRGYEQALLQINQKAIDYLYNRPETLLNGTILTIPVVFHVIHNGENVGVGANISEALLLEQLNQINLDFRSLNPDAANVPAEFANLVSDLEIEFCLAVRDPQNQFTTGILRYDYGQSEYARAMLENTIKPQTIWNRDDYLNIWTANLEAGLLGYAQFPGGTADTDGVVIAHTSVGSVANPNPNGGNYARGRTLTHEIGHWISLYHIWGDDGGACTGSDQVSDTPNQGDSYGGSPSHPQNSCGSNDMFMNYMDYVYDTAMYMFTDGQRARSDATFQTSRASLFNSQGCVPLDGFEIESSLQALEICGYGSNQTEINLIFNGSYNGTVNFSTSGLPAGINSSFTPSTLSAEGSATLVLNNISESAGQYSVTIIASDGTNTQTLDLQLNITDAISNAPQLLSPNDGATNITSSVTFDWSQVPHATSYLLELAVDNSFNSIVLSQSTSQTSLTQTNLDSDTQYYWRVKAINACNEGDYSVVNTFTTIFIPNCNDLITDGSFEDAISPNANWNEYSATGLSLINDGQPNTGSNAAALGGGSNETSIIWQTITIPANPAIAKLRYFYSIQSTDTSCNADIGGIVIDEDLNGGFSANFQNYALCVNTATNGYVENCYDLMDYAGMTINIGFFVQTDNTGNSTLYIDDIELIICNDAPQNIPGDTAEYIADYELTTPDGWTHYIDDNQTPCNFLDDLRLLSVKKENEDIGNVNQVGFEVKLSSNPSSTSISAPYNDFSTDYFSMNRFWELTPTVEPTNALEVKHYFKQSDIAGLENASGNQNMMPSEFITWKINDNPTVWDSDPVNGHVGVTPASSNGADGLWQFDYGVSSQTEFSYTKFPGLVSGQDYAVSQYVSHFGGGGVAFKNSASYNISGMVLYDSNSLSDNEVNGSPFTPKPTLYIAVINSSSQVVAYQELPERNVANEGVFNFTEIASGSYTIVLRETEPTLNETITEASIPLNYFFTGEHLGVGVGSDGTIDGKLSIELNQNISDAKLGLVYFRRKSTP